MGCLLSIPAAIISAIPLLSEKGLVYWLYFIISYVYLKLEETFRKKRFDLYDIHAVRQPERNGFYVAKQEIILDRPSKTPCLEKYSDDAFVFGTNSNSEYLAVCVCRRPNQLVQCSLLLQLSDGKQYFLPKEQTIQMATSEANTFGSFRLKLQCMIPMRKWRIFFNGTLEERTSSDLGNFTTKQKHVKFTFIWTASSGVFDFSRDLSKYLLSNAIASLSILKSPANILEKLNEVVDGYDQPGMILGTMKIENEPEKEIYLWGARRRFMGRNMLHRQGSSTKIYANFKDGSQLHLSAINNCGCLKKLQYGYIMKPTGFIYPIDVIIGEVEEIPNAASKINCYADGICYEVHITQESNSVRFQKECGENSTCKTLEITMNGKHGRGLVFKGIETNCNVFPIYQSSYTVNDLNLASRKKGKISTLCIPFDNVLCRISELCGGKGSSLGNLFDMSLRNRNSSINFCVPKGVIVSTDAYEEFTKGMLLESLRKFEKDVWLQRCDTQLACQKMVELVSTADLPDVVTKSITENLVALFGNSPSEYKFAVRSSATGEDTEQMSAAGQMKTFLGLRSMDEILNAVKTCWASQFSFQAVEYKRGYGQPINTPMAVVIQEMVACEKAGVIFTCDPVNGNPSIISITANWGLGESVVSASADPDTVTLCRTLGNELSVKNMEVGQKKSKIVMEAGSGTKEVIIDDTESSVCCINEIMALKLGQISVEMENVYGTPRDIEWGIVGEEVYLFQSRPVTSLDIETDFETKHFFDAYQRTEKAFLTRANIGEVIPGAISPLGLDVLQKIMDVAWIRQFVSFSDEALLQKPYYQKNLLSAYNQMFTSMIGGFLKFNEKDEELTKSLIISIFGRFIDKTEVQEELKNRNYPPVPFTKKISSTVYNLYLCFLSGVKIRFQSGAIRKTEIPYQGMSALDILHEIANNHEIVGETLMMHSNCSVSSSIWNLSILKLLARAKGDWDNDVFSDFAYLLSKCNDLESANIPNSLQHLGVAIREEIDPEKFRKMSNKDILNWLKGNRSEAGMKFREFIERHGHRCLKETDVYMNTWSTDPTPIISMLKNFVSDTATKPTSKTIDSFQNIIAHLKVKLSFIDRCLLRFLLPNAMRGVQEREYGKSLFILMVDKMRKPFYKIAEVMVAEGRLPRKELLFFLSIYEIQQLFDTRSPRLVGRAIRRYKAQDELDKLIFPEICVDIPKPINNTEDLQITGNGFKMTGVPVSQGVIKAPARVVMELKEATCIQQGDILITYSTDIGWSPYFPLLSGIVTELGGLISHGAVVAREFGLPCVVGLHGATRAFKSGDIVVLDGNNGTLQKVDGD